MENFLCSGIFQKTFPGGGSRTAVSPKIKLFVAILNDLKSLTTVTKSSILGVAAVLDLPMFPAYVLIP